jgi:ParB-like chromosome segregation protein Spo0J
MAEPASRIADGAADAPPAPPVRIALDAILVDPRKNVGRGGRVIDPTGARTLALASSLEQVGLEHPVVVRSIDPVRRADGRGSYTHTLRAGFRRIAAARLARTWPGMPPNHCPAGWPDVFAYVRNDLDECAAGLHSLADNVREALTDADRARAFWMAAELGSPDDQIARAAGERVSTVETFRLIAERCPADLLDWWQSDGTKDARRHMEHLSRIDLASPELRDRAQRDDHERFLRERAAEGIETEPGRVGRPNADPFGRALFRARREMASSIREGRAHEVWSPSRQTFVPLSADAAEAVLVALSYRQGAPVVR